MLLLLALAGMATQYLIKRAMKSVLKALRTHNALTAATAQFPDVIGLKKKGLLQGSGTRDYKPAALQYFMKEDIVRVTEEGKIYLSEETLLKSRMESKIGIKK